MGKGHELTFFQRRYKNGQQVQEKVLNITNHQGNANQNNKISLYTWQNGYHQKDKDNKCCQGCGEKGTLVYCRWQGKLVQPLWKKIWRLPKKLKIEILYDSAILFLGIYTKEMKYYVTEIFAPPCPLRHYLQQPRHVYNLSVHQQMNG